MEQGLGSDSGPGSYDKSRVLDVKPLRCVPPISAFPPFGSQVPHPPSGLTQFYPPFFDPLKPQYPTEHQNQQTPCGRNNHPIQTPTQPAGVDIGISKKNSKTPLMGAKSTHENVNKGDSAISISEEHGFSNSNIQGTDAEATSNGARQRTRSKTKRIKISEEARLSSQDGDSVAVANILMKYDALRRRIAQVEEEKGASKRPDLKAGTIMMGNGLRTNMRKRIGNVPGVEVGDIFFFRIEMCLVGLHTPSMAGIDYMVLKFDQVEEPVSVSIVSAGVYEDDVDDGDVLIYSGQGGNIYRKDGKDVADQKLERGNLALEKSLHRANEVRVIRGVKDIGNPTGKVYIYDGLYRIQESWTEKGKAGVSVFKYKLVRVPGQPEAFTVWKAIQQWRANISSRPGLILPDLTSGAEKLPVPLVNDIDDERGPAHFVYFPGLKYSKPVNSTKHSIGCNCQSTCLPSSNCSCVQKNGGDTPYANGVLVIQKPLIHECGPSCACYPNCKNQVSQNGPKVRLEVFKTKDRGWGLRSWDPIRAGTFICEYAGEVIDKDEGGGQDVEDEYIFNATHTGDYSIEWNYVPELLGEEKPVDLNEAYKPPLPMMISAKNVGNVARFMNHSCSPNVFWQLVLCDQNEDSYPHIMFYAIKHIPPMIELTYDYGECGRMKQCLCGSAKCRSYFG
ncbi:SET domain [Macleaya cordata]|uniref:SET domain n=1 Tax=Macleaya cordata TaxID=56857 RepID=A0A200R3C0_MACCD|nr:SET domain [Macleaya cordata]